MFLSHSEADSSHFRGVGSWEMILHILVDFEFKVKVIVLSIDPKGSEMLQFQPNMFQIQSRWQHIQSSIFEILGVMYEVGERFV